VRIESLVPSLTLRLFAFGLTPVNIVGRTPWCIHPQGEVEAVPVVGGTKTPTLSKIKAARPDLVVMDRDENPKAVYEWCLDQGFSTFVCHVRHPQDVPNMLRELGSAVGREDAAEAFATSIESELAHLPVGRSKTALPLIWHDPLMAANGMTYAGNMLTCLGFKVPNIEPEGTGYPVVSPDSIIAHGVTDLFLSSEPHEFTTAEGQELHAALAEKSDHPPAIHFIDGEDLTWMGSRTAEALRRLRDTLDVS